jgi:hypothetical protein
MTKAISIVVLWLNLSIFVFAGFELPPKVFTFEKFEEAKKLAKEMNLPIMFVLSDKTSTCGQCNSSTLKAIDEFDKKAVVIYLETKDINAIPEIVYQAISPEKLGTLIPRLAFFDSEVARHIVSVSCDEIDAGNKTFREIRKKLSDLKKESLPSP